MQDKGKGCCFLPWKVRGMKDQDVSQGVRGRELCFFQIHFPVKTPVLNISFGTSL